MPEKMLKNRDMKQSSGNKTMSKIATKYKHQNNLKELALQSVRN